MLKNNIPVAFVMLIEHDAGMRGADELRQLGKLKDPD